MGITNNVNKPLSPIEILQNAMNQNNSSTSISTSPKKPNSLFTSLSHFENHPTSPTSILNYAATNRVIPSLQSSPSNPSFYQDDESEINHKFNSEYNAQSDKDFSWEIFVNLNKDSNNLNSKINSSNSKESSPSTQEINKSFPLYKDDEVTIENIDDLLFNQNLFESNIQKSSRDKPINNRKKHNYVPQIREHLLHYVKNYPKKHNGNIPNKKIVTAEFYRKYNELYRKDPKNFEIIQTKLNNRYKRISEEIIENNTYLKSLNKNDKLELRQKFESEFRNKYQGNLDKLKTAGSVKSKKHTEWVKFIQKKIHQEQSNNI